MSFIKECYFDIFMAKLKGQNQKKIFNFLAEQLSMPCATKSETLRRIFEERLGERTFSMGNGIAIFDIKSHHIKMPVLAIMTFENHIPFNAPDNKAVTIMAAVLSPVSCIPSHLQRLAGVARLLHSKDLCTALRDIQDDDAMRMLFTPTQSWMAAA